ncbi:Hemolysin III family protein [Spironucleus salmonicida]|uniref:Hemolysin III family protein n=1 Tax=Spironucleus salmonicida TaxID=348837 RepID=V6LRB1_9EUKA|nr:Hemolysin III family protein [Spironucleus salmonicida]|eukprot:EST43319.1 Hemolysin III family protein [Spironucleus salmonicida]
MSLDGNTDLNSDTSDTLLETSKDDGFPTPFDLDFESFTRLQLKNYCQIRNYKIDSITNEFFNWASHLASFLAILIISIYLIDSSDSGLKKFAFSYYLFSNCLMLGGSVLHHGIGLNGYSIGLYRLFRMVDHCGIFFVISGTFAPIALVCCGRVGFAVFYYLNFVMILAVSLKLTTRHTLNQNVFNFVYLAMGWSSIFLLYFIQKSIGWGAVVWLFFGGTSYSVGIVFFQLGRPNPWRGVFCSHEIWHCFVSLGVFLMVPPMFSVLKYAEK